MDDLSDAVTSLKNVVARPGTFTDLYPETTDDDLIGVLIDALGELHLEGLLVDNLSDDGGFVEPELSSGQAAAVVLFAAARFVRAELLNREQSARYKAGPTEYEVTYAVNVLRDILNDLIAQKKRFIETGDSGDGAHAFYMADQYLARLCPVGVSW